MNTGLIAQMIACAHDLDATGLYNEADVLFRIATSVASMDRVVQIQPTLSIQQASNVWNIPRPEPNNSGVSTLLARIEGLKKSITNNTTIPTELRQVLATQLQAALSLLGQNQPVSAEIGQGKLRRVAGETNVMGLENQIKVIEGLSRNTLAGGNQQLFFQIQKILNTCRRYIKQYEKGVETGYQANDAAQIGGGVPSPVQGLPMHPVNAGDDWAEVQGTTYETFLERCKAWAKLHGGVAALVPHLQQQNVPGYVVGKIMGDIDPVEVFKAGF